ncbi:hypothetical protein [Neobacillus sp. LXY-1]|uniref:hypothetical protein n=1 Tax=Neobacillus sp. LXY-1 TaxID=3379133 RepID=UPI003EE3164F
MDETSKILKSILLALMVLPWLTIPLMGKASFKRFLPAGLFIASLVWITNFIAKKRRWWWWYEKLNPRLSGVIPFMFGPIFVGSLWILKWTYGKFFRYLGLNLIFDSFFTYVVVYYLKKFGIASLVRMTKLQLMYVFTVLVFLLYSFQYIKEWIAGRKKDNFSGEKGSC